MNHLLYRKDNKKLMLGITLAFLLLIITSLIINILNTKNVLNMYIIFLVSASFIFLYFLIYPFIIKKNKEPLKLSDNNLAFIFHLTPIIRN